MFLISLQKFRYQRYPLSTERGDPLSYVPVGLEAIAEDGDEDQGEHDGKAEDLKFLAEGVGSRKGRFRLISSLHQTAEYNAQGRCGEVSACQGAAVDGHGSGELIHFGLVTDH